MKTIARLLVKFSWICGLFGATACSTQTALPPAVRDPRSELAGRVHATPELAVLFVGNSYSFGAPRAFSKLAAAHGKKVRVGHSTNSGWSLAIHAENPGTLRKIREGKWDIVVLQEHSEIPAMSAGKRAAAMFPPLRQLVTEIRQHGAIPVLYQTWGRRDGEKGIWRDDFHAMNSRLRDGYQAAARNAGGVVVVPVGDAWEREISAGNGGGLFMPDGSHPTQAGNELTSIVFYEALFGK
ncbi:MAG: SGNH/GDSL hydrolase family protein [Verrucomicrobiota bacterium]